MSKYIVYTVLSRASTLLAEIANLAPLYRDEAIRQLRELLDALERS